MIVCRPFKGKRKDFEGCLDHMVVKEKFFIYGVEFSVYH